VSFEVKLGWQRQPVNTQSNLLDSIFGDHSGGEFSIFTFPSTKSQTGESNSETYDERLKKMGDRIRDGLDTGDYNWVVGNRGTGKTEAIMHLMRQVNSLQPDAPQRKEYRIPLFISAINQTSRPAYYKSIEAHDDGLTTWAYMDYLARICLAETMEWIVENPKSETNFPDLRKVLLKKASDGFSLNWEVAKGLLEDPDMTLHKFLKTINKRPNFNGLIKPLLLIDDLDKKADSEVERILSKAQSELQSLISSKVLFIFSVKPSFMDKNRTNTNMNYLLESSRRSNSNSELWVPEVSHLRASDLQEFIQHRLSYLGPKAEAQGWVLKDDRRPKSPEEVKEMVDNWATYDILSLKDHGSMRILSGWLIHSGQTGVRDLLKAIEPLLIEIPSSEDKQLVPGKLLDLLKKNDQNQVDLVIEHLKKMILETKISEGWLNEENILMQKEGSEELFDLLIHAVQDRVATGKWMGSGWRSLSNRRHGAADLIGHGRFGKDHRDDMADWTSPNRLVLELARQLEMSSSEDLLPEVHSRTPLLFFQLLRKNPRILSEVFTAATAFEIDSMKDSNPPVQEKLKSQTIGVSENESIDPVEDSSDDEMTVVGRSYKKALPSDITKKTEADLTDYDISEAREEIAKRLVQDLLNIEKLNVGIGKKLSQTVKNNFPRFKENLIFWIFSCPPDSQQIGRYGTSDDMLHRKRNLGILRSLRKTLEATNLDELKAFLTQAEQFEQWFNERKNTIERKYEPDDPESEVDQDPGRNDIICLKRGHVQPNAIVNLKSFDPYLEIEYKLYVLDNWLGLHDHSLEKTRIQVQGRLSLMDAITPAMEKGEAQNKGRYYGQHSEVEAALKQLYALLFTMNQWYAINTLEDLSDNPAFNNRTWKVMDVSAPQVADPDQILHLIQEIRQLEGIITEARRRVGVDAPFYSSENPLPWDWTPSDDEEDDRFLDALLSNFQMDYNIDIDARFYCSAEYLWEKIISISNQRARPWIEAKSSNGPSGAPVISFSTFRTTNQDSKMPANGGWKRVRWELVKIHYDTPREEKLADLAEGQILCSFSGPAFDPESPDWQRKPVALLPQGTKGFEEEE